jgi:tyrosinase
MTLLGPGGGMVAQDDDSGVDRNPRIVSDLTPGNYAVQVRHYNASGGTGRYAIKVTKG